MSVDSAEKVIRTTYFYFKIRKECSVIKYAKGFFFFSFGQADNERKGIQST